MKTANQCSSKSIGSRRNLMDQMFECGDRASERISRDIKHSFRIAYQITSSF